VQQPALPPPRQQPHYVCQRRWATRDRQLLPLASQLSKWCRESCPTRHSSMQHRRCRGEPGVLRLRFCSYYYVGPISSSAKSDCKPDATRCSRNKQSQATQGTLLHCRLWLIGLVHCNPSRCGNWSDVAGDPLQTPVVLHGADLRSLSVCRCFFSAGSHT
jgi:hypothetical protein